MMRRTGRALAVMAACAASPALADRMGAYDYPFVSPLAATVAATPPAYQAPLPDSETLDAITQDRAIVLFPERETPPVFWYYGYGLPYALLPQPGPAPLAFSIAGTGAGYDAAKAQVLASILYHAGFHVVALPNPTHPSFIVAGSTTGVPGRLADDARDLYRAMRAIRGQIADRVAITGHYLAGYSMGATHAAFVAKLDREEGALGFERVLMVNPAVSLLTSIKRLDALIDTHLRQDPDAVARFVNDIFSRLHGLADPDAQTDFTDDQFIYRAYTALAPPERDLELLIGLAFRFTSNDMAFTSDVMTRAGYLVPPDARITSTTSLTGVFMEGMGLSFENYYEQVYAPFFLRREPGARGRRAWWPRRACARSTPTCARISASSWSATRTT